MNAALRAHNKLRDEILVALSAAGLGVFWANETGSAFRETDEGRRDFIKYGLKGSSDIIGCAVGGRFVGIEVKTGAAVQSDRQKKWSKRITDCGGISIVGRSVEQALADVRTACRL